MATNVAEIEFIPDEAIDFVPDEPAEKIDFVPDVPDEVDPVVAAEAQRATTGAVQAMQVMAGAQGIDPTNPGHRFDWSDVNEKMDAERFRESEGLKVQGHPEQAAALAREITPFTTAGQYLAKQKAGEARMAADTAATAARGSTPASALSSFLGPGLTSSVQPVIESAGRNIGPAVGGAIGAARFVPHPGAQAIAAIGMPIMGALMGGITGGEAQEALLRVGETPEETRARAQRAAEDAAANPGLTKIGATAANLPFFGPSLATFGKAASGDIGAIRNIAIGGTIGAATQVGVSKLEGRELKLEDAAEAFFMGAVMNEPTKLGRKLGLHPSSEQAAIEAAQGYPAEVGAPPIGDAASTSESPKRKVRAASIRLKDGTVIDAASHAFAYDKANSEGLSLAGVEEGFTTHEGEFIHRDEALRRFSGSTTEDLKAAKPIVEKIEASDIDLLASLGVEPSAEPPVVESPVTEAPVVESPVTSNAAEIVPAIRVGDKVVRGNPGETHQDVMRRFMEESPDDAVEAVSNFDTKENPNFFVDAAGNEISRAELKDRFGVSDSQGLRDLQGKSAEPISPVEAEPAPPSTGEPVARAGEEPPPIVPPTRPAAAEPVPAPEGATSNKEAVVNAERAARDLDPIIKEAKITNAESIDRAQTAIEQNPLKPQEIVARLRENPQERTISLEDSAVLLVERTKLNKQREGLLDRATDESLDPTERAAAKTEFEAVETRLNELDQAAQDARSTWGRFGQLWQRSMRQDFTLEPMLRRARLQKGEALSPEESAQIKTIADDVAAKQEAADAAVVRAEVTQTEKRVDEAIKSSAQEPHVDPVVRTLAERIIAKLDLQAAQARKDLREYFKNLNAFVPDPRILTKFATLAANRVAKSAIKAGQWVAEMVQEFGEMARPYAERAWEMADKQLDTLVNAGSGDPKKRAATKAKIVDSGVQQDRVTKAIGERLKEGDSIDDMGRYVGRLVEAIVRGGTKDRPAVLAAVKGALEPLAPGITDRQVLDLVSRYGESPELSKDPVKVVAAQIKAETLQLSKLEALAAKEALQKTGPKRYPQTDEQRRLTKEVNEAKKKAGVTTTDPETQLKSTMDSARTRFSNQIKDLTFEIETGQRPPTKTPIEYDADIQVMRGLRDRLKQTVRDLEGKPELTEEQRIAMTTRGLQDSIAALEARIAGGQPKTKRAAPDTPEIRALKAQRDALRAQLNEVESADMLLRENRKAESLVRSIERAEAELAGATKPGKQQGPESQLVAEAREQLAAVREQVKAKRDADPEVQQARMDAAEAAVEKSIKKLDEQLQAGDIAAQRAPSKAASQRLEDLRMQRDALNRLRAQLRAEARPKPNPLDVAIKARKAQLERQRATYEERIAKNDFGPRTRKPAVDLSGDPAALDALAKVQEAKDKFTKLQHEWELKNRTKTEKFLGGVKQAWDAVRNLKLSMDLSAPLQAAFSIASHPIEGAKAIGKGARAFAEQMFRNQDTYAKRVEQQIVNSPNNKNGVYKAMKLDLSEITGTKREENAGSILEKLADLESRWQDVPEFAKGLVGMSHQPLVKSAAGIAKAAPKLLGMSIKASNAGFGAIANHMRARTADAVLARWARRRVAPTKLELELLGNHINAATGKGGLQGEEGIRALLFAPNYYLSKLKLISLQPAIKAGIKHQGAAVREILEEYVRAAITATSVGVLSYLFGNRKKQTLDPRDPNFAKAMTNKGTSMDLSMGFGAYVTLATQLAKGERIDKKGRVVKQDEMSAFMNFLKGRLSREISTALTTAKGDDFRGKPLDAAGLAKALVAPISWQDVDKVIKREGLTRGSFIQMMEMLGVTSRVAD